MTLIELAQILMVGTGAVLVGRVGFALTRWVERRLSSSHSTGTEERLQALEEESARLRQELAELQDRQEFTERALLQDPGSSRAVPPG